MASEIPETKVETFVKDLTNEPDNIEYKTCQYIMTLKDYTKYIPKFIECTDKKIVMEKLVGYTELIKVPECDKKRWSSDELNQFLKLLHKKLIEILEFLHSNGIVHRDIKGQNIMIKFVDFQNFDIKIIDFNCSKLKSDYKILTSELKKYMDNPLFNVFCCDSVKQEILKINTGEYVEKLPLGFNTMHQQFDYKIRETFSYMYGGNITAFASFDDWKKNDYWGIGILLWDLSWIGKNDIINHLLYKIKNVMWSQGLDLERMYIFGKSFIYNTNMEHIMVTELLTKIFRYHSLGLIEFDFPSKISDENVNNILCCINRYKILEC